MSLPPLFRDHPDVPAGARAYIRALESGDPDGAAGAFSEHCLYSREAGVGGGSRIEMRSQEEICSFFRQRGKQNWLHHCEVVATAGRRTFVEGVVSGGAGRVLGSFCLSLELDEDGKVSRSVAYSATPPIGTAPAPCARSVA